jgi:hypothetical protein
MTKAKQIRAFKEANPTAIPKDIATVCGVSTTYVYQVLHHAKKKKAKEVAKATPTDGQKIVRNEVNRLHKDIDDWRALYLQALDEVEQLNQDVVGYRAVISYLQGQLDGATV